MLGSDQDGSIVEKQNLNTNLNKCNIDNSKYGITYCPEYNYNFVLAQQNMMKRNKVVIRRCDSKTSIVRCELDAKFNTFIKDIGIKVFVREKRLDFINRDAEGSPVTDVVKQISEVWPQSGLQIQDNFVIQENRVEERNSSFPSFYNFDTFFTVN